MDKLTMDLLMAALVILLTVWAQLSIYHIRFNRMKDNKWNNL